MPEPISAETLLDERPDGTPTTQAEGNTPLPTRAEREALFGVDPISIRELGAQLESERPQDAAVADTITFTDLYVAFGKACASIQGLATNQEGLIR